MKPRKKKSPALKTDKKRREGRSYQDFLQFTAVNPTLPIVEMDSVIGAVGDKALLAIVFRESGLLLAFIRNRNTSQSVIDVFEQLYSTLGREVFCKLFPVILTDNGSEFSNQRALAFDPAGRRRARIFYRDPNAAFQKPFAEVSHTLIRRIIPKGKSFDALDQLSTQRIVSHINSYLLEKS